jgi:hypothetical protein
MPRVSAWASVQPECRLPAAERLFVAKRHGLHLGALKTVKSSIDNRAPPKAMGANMVKVALRQEEIDRTNVLLKTKLSNMHVPKSYSKRMTHISVSTVASVPSNEKAKAVARENSLMRQRLDRVRPALNVHDQQKDFARHEKYLKQISRVTNNSKNAFCTSSMHPAYNRPNNIVTAALSSPPSLVPFRDELPTVSSGWSDELWGNRT